MKKKIITAENYALLTKNGISPSTDAANPELPVEVELKVKIVLEHWKGFLGSSRMRMAFNDNSLIISTDKDKKVGEIVGCLGASMEFRLNDHQYGVSGKALWDAFCEAVGKPNFKITPKKEIKNK